MELKFRKLKEDEIDCRVQQIKPNGLTLLLYKDARCDQNILDETVGAMNLARSGSPGSRMRSAIWPFSAAICGVLMKRFLLSENFGSRRYNGIVLIISPLYAKIFATKRSLVRKL